MRVVAAVYFRDEVVRACGGHANARYAQVDYLARYLLAPEMGAHTLVIEEQYVDRHYREEFSAYYASLLHAPVPTCTRIHCFARSFDDARLHGAIEGALRQGDPRALARVLRDDFGYLGFVTIRPLAAAPIGRTVLRPYRDRPSRDFAPARYDSRVHLFGATLVADGLPFQQQEQGVGACATTALWSALAAVAHRNGDRAPTPLEVTLAATKHHLQDRQFPALGGLELVQLASAIHEHGYAPYRLRPSDDPDSFLWSLKTYLASGIPVVLVLGEKGAGHAVAVAGYRRSDADELAPDLEVTLDRTTLRTTAMTRLYLHDDREGPYVRYAVDRTGETFTCAR